MAVVRGPLEDLREEAKRRKQIIASGLPTAPVRGVPAPRPSSVTPVSVSAPPTVSRPPTIVDKYGDLGRAMVSGRVDSPRETTRADVESAAVEARQRAAGYPQLTGQQYNELTQEIESIAAGESDGGGSWWENLRADKIFQQIQDAIVPDFVMEGATGAGDVVLKGLAIPGRTVESVAQELTDLVTTDPRETEFSFVDLVTQPFDFKNFNPEYTPVSSTIELLGGEAGDTAGIIDNVLSFGAKIAADPLTATLATPLKYQGAVGRNAAAQDLLSWQRSLRSQRPAASGRTAVGRPTGTAPLTGGVPESVGAVGRGLSEAEQASLARDIYRYGIDKLPTEVREAAVAAGIFPQAGVRVWGGTVPWTQGAGESIALFVNNARARFGDIGGGAVGLAMTPKSRLPLAQVARTSGDITDPVRVLDQFATVRAAQEAKSAAGQFTNRFIGRYGPLVKELSKLGDEESRIVIGLAEGAVDRAAVTDERLLRLADTLASAEGEILFEFNAARQAISDAAGLRIAPVSSIDNYVHRTLTDKARNWFRKPSNKDKARGIATDFGADTPALRANEGFTMSRNLNGKFMGETLTTGPLITKVDGTQVRAGTIDEINRISREKLGFDMFESRAEKILANYMQSVGKQLQRHAFIDKMFKYRPNSIAPLLGTSKKAREAAKLVKEFNEVVARIDRMIVGGKGIDRAETVAGQMVDSIRRMRDTAIAVSSPQFKQARAAQRAARVAKAKLDEINAEIAATRGAAEARRVEIDQAALDVLDALEARVRSLTAAIEAGDGEIAIAREWLNSKHQQLFPDMADRPTAPAELARDIIRESEQKLAGAARQSVVGKTERLAAQANRIGKTVDVDGVQMPLAAAREALPKAESAVRKAEAAWKRTIDKDPVLKEFETLNNKAARSAASFDQKAALAGEADEWMATVGDLYAADIATIRDLLKQQPRKGDGYEMTLDWTQKVVDTFYNLSVAEMDDATREAITRVMAQLFGDEALLARREANRLLGEAWGDWEQRVRAGLVDEAYTDEVIKGWQKITEMQVQVNPQLAETFNGIYAGLVDDVKNAIRNDGERGLLGQLFDQTLRYFKSTAILTAGFTTRNAVTAAFNNWIAGVSASQMKESLDFARNWRRGGLENAYTMLERSSGPEAVARMRAAVDALLATGGGKNVDEIIPVVGRKNRVRFNNKAADAAAATGDLLFRPFAGRLSANARRANEWVEIGMRLPLALNSIDRGYSGVQAAAQIARFQFDYSDLSELDEQAKRVLPFWVFASRNIPLQTVNRAIAFGKYNAYDRFQQGMEQYEDPEIPRWRRERNPISWLGGWYTDLDLPFQNLTGEASELASFGGFVGQAAPLPRAIIEGITGQRIAFGGSYPYSDDYIPISTLDLPSQLAWLISDQKRNVEGQRVLPENVTQPIMGTLPALQNVQRYAAAVAGFFGQESREESVGRLVGGQERYYSERDPLNTLFAALGVPVQRVTDADRDREARRRQAEINQLLEDKESLGYGG